MNSMQCSSERVVEQPIKEHLDSASTELRATQVEQNICPLFDICPLSTLAPDCPPLGNPNLQFLRDRIDDGTADEALTLARIAWFSFPNIRLSADAKTMIDAMMTEVRETVSQAVTPLGILTSSLEPLLKRIDELAKCLPDDVKMKFDDVNRGLQEQIAQVKELASKAPEPVLKQVSSLQETIYQLLNKPAARGQVAESAFCELWQSEFIKDKVIPKGGPGKADLVVTPYIQEKNQYGKKISVERKTGKQRYSATHVEEAVRHARVEGASYIVLVYDCQTNLPEAIRPIHIAHEEELFVVIVDLETGGWKTCRWILETFQTVLDNPEQTSSLPVKAISELVHEMHSLTNDVETLKASCNGAKCSIDKVDKCIAELEKRILRYLARLRDLLSESIPS